MWMTNRVDPDQFASDIDSAHGYILSSKEYISIKGYMYNMVQYGTINSLMF